MEEPDWWVEFVSAPDLETLSLVPGKQRLFPWKLMDQKRFLANHSIRLFNANGLLNLCGWSEETHSFMLPTGVGFEGDPINIFVPTDCLMKVRRKIRKGWDVHALLLPNGKFVRVRRIAADSFFPGEGHKSQYRCIEALQEGHLLGASLGKRLTWWLSAKPGRTQLSRDLVFRIWDAVRNWLDRAVPLFERAARDLTGHSVHIILDYRPRTWWKDSPCYRGSHSLRICWFQPTGKEYHSHLSLCNPFFGGFQRARKTLPNVQSCLRSPRGYSCFPAKHRANRPLTLLSVNRSQ